MLSTLHNKTLMKRRNAERGFTLIELLVVIVIIGILAAIAIPAFLNQRATARDASVTSDIRNAATEVQTAFTKYPGATYFAVKSGKTTDNTGITPGAFVEGDENGVITFFVGKDSTDCTSVTANLSKGNRIAIAYGYVPGEYMMSVYNPSGKEFDGVLLSPTKRRAQLWNSIKGGLQD